MTSRPSAADHLKYIQLSPDSPIIWAGLGSQMRVVDTPSEQVKEKSVGAKSDRQACKGNEKYVMETLVDHNRHRRIAQADDELTDAQCTQIDNLMYTIIELRGQGKKHITPFQVLRVMLDRKQFSSAARLSFTELIALAVRRGFVNYIRADDALFVSGFEWDEGAVEGDAAYMPRMEKRDGRLVRE